MLKNGKIWSKTHKRFIGSLNNEGYVKVKFGDKTISVHIIIWSCVNGDIPIDEKGKPYHVHHIDGNKQNNSIYNLELLHPSKHHSLHGNNMSEETKNKLRIINLGNKFGLGIKRSEEFKKKQSDNMKGFKHSKETKQKMSKSQTNNPLKSKKVVQLTLDMDFIKIWESTKECNRNKYWGVAECCRGERKTCKGFKWMFLDDYLKTKKEVEN